MLHVVKTAEHSSARGRTISLRCIVPVFNESAGITEFLEALYQAARKITIDVELVVVNDGSSDDSGAKILACARRCAIRYLELSRNFGKEIAIQAGLDVADADCVVILDADFQHPISLISTMVDRWQHGIDMVYAVKSTRKGESWLKRLASTVFYRLLPTERGVHIPRDAGDFRLLDRKIVEALRLLPERGRFMKGLYAWVGFKSEAIPFTPAPRESGSSKFGMLRLASLACTGVTAFSVAPLRWVSVGGALVSSASIAMAAWLIGEKLIFGQPIPGFATIAASIFFLAGVQLLALGIVGEYVGRIFEEVKGRPRYLIADDQRPHVIEKLRPAAPLENRFGG